MKLNPYTTIHTMKNLLLILTLLIACIPVKTFAKKSNIEIHADGQIGEIYYKNISRDYRGTILAQLVADDVIKKAKSLAEIEKYLDAHQLLSAITYLDYNNTNVLELEANYIIIIAQTEKDKAKLYKNYFTEAENTLKTRKSNHNIDLMRGLIIANTARSLYSENTEEYKNANDIFVQIKQLIRVEELSVEVINKLLSDAKEAAEQGNYIRAINKFAILYYAENSTMPLVEIVKILELIE